MRPLRRHRHRRRRMARPGAGRRRRGPESRASASASCPSATSRRARGRSAPTPVRTGSGLNLPASRPGRSGTPNRTIAPDRRHRKSRNHRRRPSPIFTRRLSDGRNKAILDPDARRASLAQQQNRFDDEYLLRNNGLGYVHSLTFRPVHNTPGFQPHLPLRPAAAVHVALSHGCRHFVWTTVSSLIYNQREGE